MKVFYAFAFVVAGTIAAPHKLGDHHADPFNALADQPSVVKAVQERPGTVKPTMLMPYKFKYDVADEEYGVQMAHNVDSDGIITVGEYNILLPDARMQIVKYRSDPENGYQAEITYQ
ncbi:unnamed protein product [Meganyctiphanes norvegica]|uniref:Cuticle protein n=1 Tax=Meganyctiphanes norvegica TaxID=48144 RepID=A0AAV2QZX1_MEGNR